MTTETSINRMRANVRYWLGALRRYRAETRDRTSEWYGWYVHEIREFWKLYRAAWRRYLQEKTK